MKDETSKRRCKWW